MRGVSLSIQRGEIVFIFGASGAGKSTLLYTLAGLERPEEGEVLFEGQSLYRLSGDKLASLRNRRMGFIFQSYCLLPELTALENVALPARIAGREASAQARELLELVGLGHRLHHLPSELSGGEQQRTAIARALVNNPVIIFADEPTGNLDSKTGTQILTLLLDVAKERKCTLLVVTHDRNLAEHGTRTILIQDGQLI
ncbi:MAG: ABC transporter ATP-binding protein [Chthoniobacterales bacterium]|nr:ABC transporter ATP-binding protein [Chthoniobacterales bacterium]